MMHAPDIQTDPAKKSITSGFLVSGTIIKLVYAGMLIRLPIEQIREFWKKNVPPGFPAPLEETKLFTHIWDEETWVPLTYIFSVFNSLEPFLSRHDIAVTDFIAAMLKKIANGLVFPASVALTWGRPFLKLFFQKRDIRLLLLRLAHYFSAKTAPDIVHRIVSHASDGAWNSTTLLFMLSRKDSSGKKTFFQAFPPYDGELWTAMVTQSIPYCLNLPDFEERFMRADCRDPVSLVAGGSAAIADGKFFIEGKQYGVVTSFFDFLREYSIELARFGIPETQVVVMTKDFFCDRKKRVILHDRCAYSSPVYLYGFKYRKDISIPKDFFSSLIASAVTHTNESWGHARMLHEQLLDRVCAKAVLTYDIAEESMSVGGVHFVKNTPAKILRKIVRSYCSEGRTIFAYKEFYLDDSIVNDPKNPNLVVRLRRLAKTFETHCPAISLSFPARGKIIFHPSCRIEYHER